MFKFCWVVHCHSKSCMHFWTPHLFILNVGIKAVTCLVRIPIGWFEVFCLLRVMRVGRVGLFKCHGDSIVSGWVGFDL